jgi:hypothetical protein
MKIKDIETIISTKKDSILALKEAIETGIESWEKAATQRWQRPIC